MKVVIVGAGMVGTALASALAQDGHDLVVVEQDEDRAAALEASVDAQVIRGNGARPAVLEKAGVTVGGDVDVVIGCANRDEVNLMAGWLAKRAGVKQVMTRARDLEFTDSPLWAHDLGIDVMTSPERALSREILSLLQVSAAVHSLELKEGRAGSFAFRVEPTSPIKGKSLAQVGRAHPELEAIIVFVQRGAEGFVPDGSWLAQEGDVCYVVTTSQHVLGVQRLFHYESQRTLSQVMIVGGGKLGAHLAGLLEKQAGGVQVLLIDRDLEKCRKLAAEYEGVEVIHGDGLDKALLRDLGVARADGLVVTTDSDELNVMIGSLGRHLGCAKTISVVRNKVYEDLAPLLPVDALINPHETLAAIFLRHVRYPQSAGAMTLIDRIDAEMVEVTVDEASPYVGQTIAQMGLPKGALIAMISRKKRMLVPNGSTVLKAGDVVSLFASRSQMAAAKAMLELGA